MMEKITRKLQILGIVLTILFSSAASAYSQPLWNTMQNEKAVLTLSVWFTAQEVDKYLSGTEGLVTLSFNNPAVFNA